MAPGGFVPDRFTHPPPLARGHDTAPAATGHEAPAQCRGLALVRRQRSWGSLRCPWHASCLPEPWSPAVLGTSPVQCKHANWPIPGVELAGGGGPILALTARWDSAASGRRLAVNRTRHARSTGSPRAVARLGVGRPAALGISPTTQLNLARLISPGGGGRAAGWPTYTSSAATHHPRSRANRSA